MSKEEILHILLSLKEKIKKDYKAEVKGIFGSYARLDNDEQSDIDLLVEFAEEADLFDMAGLSLFLEEKLNRKIDIVPRDSLREEIKDNILEETIYI